ncbi:MAG TPA: phosphate transport system regulatory protein PhoU [Acholeplasmatales bacterium]|nr:phosphate transport system regulatory protein PhoU [Acholeplasmatales bacterium]
MRTKFDTQLETLNNDLISLGAMCESAITLAINALLKNDLNKAKQVIGMDKEISQKNREIESLCLKLLLQQQPVAKDLRLISSALKMITDMERIGHQASDLSEIISYTDVSESRNSENLLKMSQATIKMVTESIDAFVRRDLDLAKSVIAYDDVVDDLFVKIRKDLINLIGSDKKHGEQALDIMMIAKYFEKMGDHAVNIAEWVVFSITGVHEEVS